MTSKWLMYALLVQYIVLTAVTIYEKRWPVAIYWLGASVINVGVLAMAGGEQ